MEGHPEGVDGLGSAQKWNGPKGALPLGSGIDWREAQGVCDVAEEVALELFGTAEDFVRAGFFHGAGDSIGEARDDPELLGPKASRRLSTRLDGAKTGKDGIDDGEIRVAIPSHAAGGIAGASSIDGNAHGLESDAVVVGDQLILGNEEDTFHTRMRMGRF